MSRTIKQGLDYFPMDVEIDNKIELIEAKHGIAGFGIIIKLFQKIYKEGYYLAWDEDTQLLLAKRINVDINLISAVINDGFHYNLFNKNLYDQHHILTSSGIQKRYLNATNRRLELFLNKKYILVDINKIKVHINWLNDDSSTQSKVKYSKVKKSKEKESKENAEKTDFSLS